MTEPTYSVIFEGRALPGFEASAVKTAFAQRFNIAANEVEHLFAGQQISLKRNLNKDQAERYFNALKNIGVDVSLVPALPGSANPEKPTVKPSSPPRKEPPPRAQPSGPELVFTDASKESPPEPQPKQTALDPYLPPTAAVIDTTPVNHDDEQWHPARRVPISRGVGWLGDGWRLFKRSPFSWIVVTILFIVCSVVVQLIPFLGIILGALLSPYLIGGICATADHQYRGNPMSIGMLFFGFKQQTLGLLILGGIYLATSLVIIAGIALLSGGVAAFMFGFEETPPPDTMLFPILIVSLVASLFWIPTLMLLWFSPALVLLHGVAPVAAMKQSFAGCLRNVLPFLLYGIVYMLLLLIGLIPLGLGMLVVIPVAMISIYASFRDIYIE